MVVVRVVGFVGLVEKPGRANLAWERKIQFPVLRQRVSQLPLLLQLTTRAVKNVVVPRDPISGFCLLRNSVAEEGIDTLIVDTRRNGGGSDDAQVALMAYLLDQPLTLIRSKRVRTSSDSSICLSSRSASVTKSAKISVSRSGLFMVWRFKCCSSSIGKSPGV